MSSNNTRPEQIIDKNGKQTTVHKSTTSASKAQGRAAKVPAASQSAQQNGWGLDNVGGGGVQISLNDDIFNKATITRNADNKLIALGEFTISDDAFEHLADENGDLYDYFKANSEQIKNIIKAEYEADTVSIDLLDESITVGYEIPINNDADMDSQKLLDAFHETRAVTLHSHAYGSDKLSYALNDLSDDGEDDSFQPRGHRMGFDDEI